MTFEERLAEYTAEGDTDPRALIQSFSDFQSMYGQTVTNIAQKIARNYRTVEAEDLAQEVWAELATAWQAIAEEVRLSIPAVIKKRAERIANKERIDYMHFSGSYLYTPKDVRKILAESVWSEVEKAPDVEGRADVRGQFDKLVASRKVAIYKRYGLGFPYKELTKSEQHAMERGITQITDRLNQDLKFYSHSYEGSLGDVLGVSDARTAQRNQRAKQANNFLNGQG